MRLLFDQNLSRRLVDRVAIEFPASAHVIGLGLDASTDQEIWEYAGTHDFVIVSKDSDFRQFAFLFGPPPKAVWLRIGNASTPQVLDLLLRSQDQIRQFGASEDEALLLTNDASVPFMV